jgi:hypothetical protein
MYVRRLALGELVGADDDVPAPQTGGIAPACWQRCRIWLRGCGKAEKTSPSTPDTTVCASSKV